MSSTPSDPPETSTPGLARRLAAMLYDSFLLFAVTWCATALAVVVRVALVGTDAVQASGKAAASGPLLQLVLTLATVLFFGWCWTRSGQTLGMQTWRLRVQQASGAAITWRQALLRLGCAALSLLAFGAGYWWALVDREGLTWHDRCSGTRVVLLPKRR
ncbi:MAG TPA: RDD family protein [Pseudomonadales bacterium]|nr:RDD family protein [Pseudomonadales bacterium]